MTQPSGDSKQMQRHWKTVAATAFWTFCASTILWLLTANWLRGARTPIAGREAADLAAQQSMADAAWAMFTVNMLSTGVAAVGIVFVYRTLKHSQRAVEEASRSADLAAQSVTVAQAIGEAQTRAYVSLYAVEAKLDAKTLTIKFRVINSGQSPALSASLMIGASAVTDHHKRLVEAGANRRPVELGDIPAGEKADCSLHFLVRDEEAEFAPDMEILVFGEVTFEDIFEYANHQPFEFNGRRHDKTDFHNAAPLKAATVQKRPFRQKTVFA